MEELIDPSMASYRSPDRDSPHWRDAPNSDTQRMVIERLFEMPSKWTFTAPKVRAWVESRLEGKVLNMFGGVVHLTHKGEIVHNEINPDLTADLRLDAMDLEKWQGYEKSFDTIIMDPPFTAHQAVVSYGIRKAQKITHAREVVDFIIRPKGRVISLGYNTTGMSESRGYTKEAILIVNHGGSHQDLLCLSERKRS